MNIYEREKHTYEKLNELVITNGVVLFGSSFAKDIPVNELKQAYGLNSNIYNRSMTDLSVFDAKNVLKQCVTDLMPKQLLINLGETDLEGGYHSIPEIIEMYSMLIDAIKKETKHCNIVIVSICNNRKDIQPEELNKQLANLAKTKKCDFADISAAFVAEAPKIKAFGLLKHFMRDHMSFADAMLAI